MSEKTLPKAVQDCHLLLKWLIPQLDKFPRNRRFTLGERIETGVLDVLACLVEAAYSRKKLALLQKANVQLALVRHLWRLAFELQVVPVKSYQHCAHLLVELGQQIGGWQKASQ